MKKKIIGIVVCMLLMTTSVLAMGVIDTSKTEVVKENIRNLKDDNKPEPTQVCGTAWIILMGNESCMIGATIRIHDTVTILWSPLIFRRPARYTDYPVQLIQIPGHPFNGSYGVKVTSCGTSGITYFPPPSGNCSADAAPFFTLYPNEIVTVYVVINVLDN